MKLADAIAQAGGVHAGFKIPPYITQLTQGKHAYDSCCHCAGGKCDRCRESGCVDRDWRKKGREVP